MTDTHMLTWLRELDTTPTETDWYAWCAAVETDLGHSLDGDQTTDGYSLDRAYEIWAAGTSVAAAVREITERND